MSDYLKAGLKNGPMWTAVILFAVAVLKYARPDIPEGLIYLGAGVLVAILIAFGVKGIQPIGTVARQISNRSLTPKSMADPGQRAFEAYRKAVGGKTYDGKPIPDWNTVTPIVRRGWEAAEFARNE